MTDPFMPLDRLRARQYVADQLRRHIALGITRFGERLPSERELARRLKVGRSTVQRALDMLEADGLVERHRGRGGGTFVSAPSAGVSAEARLVDELHEHRDTVVSALELRAIVEPAAAALAARRAGAGDCAELEEILALMHKASDDAHLHALDTQFHQALARATGNPMLAESVEHVREALDAAILAQPDTRAWQDRTLAEHALLVEALRAHDPQSAEALMREHITLTQRGIQAALAAVGGPDETPSLTTSAATDTKDLV